MSGSPGDRTPPDPSEVFIVGADGSRNRAVAPARPPRQPAAGGRRWAALTVAGVLIFGLGIAVGTHIGDGPDSAGATTGTGAPNGNATGTVVSPAPALPRTAAPEPSATRLSAPGAASGADVPNAGTESTPAARTVATRPWPTAKGACDVDVPVPLLSGVDTLRTTTGLQVLAGNDTRRFTIDSGKAGAPLFALRSGEYVSQIAVDGAGTVAIISDCRGYPPVRVVRRSPGGAIGTITVHHAGYQVGSLITGGNRIWLSLYHAQPDAITYQDSAVLLQATDGSGTTVTLPEGFSPTAGSGDLIVGNWSGGQDSASGPIQLYDLSRRAIVAQIGDSTPVYVVDNGYVVWLDGSCTGSCPVHRYRIRTGATTVVTAAVPPSTAWTAISPDGARIVGVQYNLPDNPRYATDHPGGPTGIVMMSLRSGSVTALPGIRLAPKASPSLVFSSDSRWLIVGVDSGRNGRVLLYDRTFKHPLSAGVTVPGPVLWNIPIAVTG